MMAFIGCAKTEEDAIYYHDYHDPYQDKLIFATSFDENEGNELTEQTTMTKATIEYVFTDAEYKQSIDPTWITNSAISGACLAFDGYSNYIKYDYQDIQISGPNLTIDLFISPRMFEWDVPGAVVNGTEHLQVVLGQYIMSENQGFVIGMHKYGEYSFQIGLGDRWVKLWNEWNDLDRYTWNHLTFVFDGTNGFMGIYKNGEIINFHNDVFGEIIAANTSLYIGKSQVPQKTGLYEINMFNGLMDELKIYQASIKEEDIIAYHNSFVQKNRMKAIDFKDAWLNDELLDDDIYKPQYHASPPQHWMNEPHALFYFNGNYHLFYQFNLTGPYWRQIAWGHWVSPDMVNWRNVKEAIILMKNSVCPDGIWSGGASYKADGTPVLFFTAGDDAKSFGQWSNQNIAIAIPKDLSDPDLTEWDVSDQLVAVSTPSMAKTNEFRDPNIYFEDGTYYMFVGSARYDNKGTAQVFTTQDDSFLNWDYQGELFMPSVYHNYMGTTWELVNLAKITNANKTVSKYIFAFSPAGSGADNDIYYYLGDFDKTTMTFIPEHEDPKLMDFGNNVFTGPTVSTDPLTGRVLICSIIQGQRNGHQDYDAGWAHTAGIPRQLSLDDAGSLKITPLNELNNLKTDVIVDKKDTNIEFANQALASVVGNQLYLHVQLTNENSQNFGLTLKEDQLGRKTVLNYNAIDQFISIDTTNSGNSVVKGIFGGGISLLPGEVLDLEIFIDGAMIEIYINGYQTLTAMVYNNASEMSLFADGQIMVDVLQVIKMKTI